MSTQLNSNLVIWVPEFPNCLKDNLWLLIGATYTSDQMVEIVELVVPQYPKEGEDVKLHCRFRLGGSSQKLYTVNWYRGKDQFYTFEKSNYQPKRTFHFQGIDVIVSLLIEAIRAFLKGL